MEYRIFHTHKTSVEPIHLPASKSISNRLLIMQALANKNFKLNNISQADDSRIMQALLAANDEELNAENAGTVFRFLTAYFAIQNGEKVILTGSERMLERPIKPLVKGLIKLGADIEYLGEEGFPPLKIKGRNLKKKKLKINASKSSQFVSALMLIGPYLEGGLKIELQKPSSMPYILMTLQLMQEAGIQCELNDQLIKIKEGVYQLKNYSVEADWSSAAFIYQAFALSSLSTVRIHGLKEDSMQGDSICADVFEAMGVESDFGAGGLQLKRISYDEVPLSIDLKGQPDLILPVAVAAAFMLPSVKIKGVSSLRYKESNRLEALKTELMKIADISWQEEEDSLKLSINEVYKSIDCFEISAHQDHRIAMCLAPLVMRYECLGIDDSSVVVKSFPSFWQEISKMGIQLGEAI